MERLFMRSGTRIQDYDAKPFKMSPVT
jgi:hypothetical protein